MNSGELSPAVIFTIGPLQLTSTTLTTLGIVAVLGFLAWLLSRRLLASRIDDRPGGIQTSAEAVFLSIEDAVRAVAPDHVKLLLPFIGTLWIFLVVANLTGLIPGLHSPTRDLSATAALAILVFLSVHWFGIRDQGLRSYLRHYITPNPILLPFHVLSEITRTIALAVRLFGNMMSLEMAALLVLLVAGFLAPIPILMLHIVEALVQAYIFGMLALIYVAGGLQLQQLKQASQDKNEIGENRE